MVDNLHEGTLKLDYEDENSWFGLLSTSEKPVLRTWEDSCRLSITPLIDFAHFNASLSELHSKATDRSFIQLSERRSDYRNTNSGFKLNISHVGNN